MYRRRYYDDIKINLKEVGCEFVDWIHLVHDKDQRRIFVNTVLKLWIP
jgi:hypothetical protein